MARSANILCGRLGSSTYQDPYTTVLIWDTGVSFGLTPFKSEFIDYVKCNTIIGIGITIHKFVERKVPHPWLGDDKKFKVRINGFHLHQQTYELLFQPQ